MEFYCVLFLFFYSMQALHAGPPVKVSPRNIILLENELLEVKCQAGIPLTYCRFVIPGFKDGFNLRPTIGPFKGVEYAGDGLDKGECGMLIRNVKEMHSGTIQCTLGFEKEATESTGNITLIVAKAPDPPSLQVFPGLRVKDAFTEGEHIHANCKISNARPVANISWYLGSERIYDGLSSTLEEENDNLITISQNLTRKVTYMDHDKDLKCVASHIALREGSINHSIHKISVLFPPKPKSQELEKFGFIIGKPGKIVVTFQANPRPDITWKVDQDVLKQGDRDRTGRFQAGILHQKAGGTWDAVLNIGTVRAEEVEKRYTLIAENNFGRESYKVAISTSPEPPADITAGAIVGIVIAVLVLLLLVFILIFARATGKWCFSGGVPRPVGESELTFGSFLRREKEKNPRKVNSLIYENYTLVRKEDGIKSYVSPEEKYQILLRQKIKAEDARINWENEKKIRRWKEIDSDSDSGYEIPIEPELKAKPKSCNDLNLVTLAKHPRKSSFPLSDVEFYPEDDEKINLPFYMTSLERSATEPLTNSNKKKRKNKNRNESRTGSNGENDNEQKSDDDLSSSANGKEDKKKSKKSGFSFGNSIGFRGKDRKLKENEKETKEKTVNEFILESNEKNSKSRKKRFSLPWTKQWPSEGQNGEDDVTDESDDSQIKNPKQFAVKLPKLSWRKKKKSKIGALNGEKNSVTGENEDETQCKTEESSDEEEGKGNDGPLISHEGTKNPSNSCSSSCCEDEESFEESEEVFDKDKAPDNFLFNIRNELDELEAEEQTIKTNLLKNRFAATKSISRTIPSDLLQVKNRRLRNRGAIDPNPLKKMFGIRRPLKIDREETNSKITEKKSVEKPSNGDFSKKAVEFFDGISNERDAKDSKIPFEFLERKEIGYRDYKFLFNEPETDVQTNQLSFKISKSKILSLTVRSDGEFFRSDTESADHGSADKSSMSKLTNEKQPKTLMSGLFGSFAKGKSKDRSRENEFVRNTSSFEVTVKEQPDDVPVEETRTEGIVYAELDMARSPGNVMRREDEKTEYAEIIYPTSKMSPEKVKEELRKSRENLVSSRENLAESNETFATTMTPDGKKEAAV